MNKYTAHVLFAALLEKKYPDAPPAAGPKPTSEDVVRDYIIGTETLEPCGRVAPCERAESGTSLVDGGEWCNFCGIRVE